jgi:hypothetical protein
MSDNETAPAIRGIMLAVVVVIATLMAVLYVAPLLISWLV